MSFPILSQSQRLMVRMSRLMMRFWWVVILIVCHLLRLSRLMRKGRIGRGSVVVLILIQRHPLLQMRLYPKRRFRSIL